MDPLLAKRYPDAFGKTDKPSNQRVTSIAVLEQYKCDMVRDKTKIYVDANLQYYYIFVDFITLYCGHCWKEHITPIVKGETGETRVLSTCFGNLTLNFS